MFFLNVYSPSAWQLPWTWKDYSDQKAIVSDNEEKADIITTTQASNAGDYFIVRFCLDYNEYAEIVWFSQFYWWLQRKHRWS